MTPTKNDSIERKVEEFEKAFGYEDDGLFRMDINTSDRDAVRDWLRQALTSAKEEGRVEERERIRINIENALSDVVEPPEDAKKFMGDWERGVVTGAYTAKIDVLQALTKQ